MMSPGNVESVRRGIAAFNRRDWDAALAGFHADVEWEVRTDIAPDPGTYRGHAQLRGFWETWTDTIQGFRMEIEECIDAGNDRVLVVTRARGAGKGSGVPVEAMFAQLYEYREGKVARVRMFGSTAAALKAAGLPPRTG